jgi:hypothetical protein
VVISLLVLKLWSYYWFEFKVEIKFAIFRSFSDESSMKSRLNSIIDNLLFKFSWENYNEFSKSDQQSYSFKTF